MVLHWPLSDGFLGYAADAQENQLLRDARTVPPDSSIGADVCVIGAGAAGITVARRLSHTGRQVVLLEAGGLDFDSETQALYRGENLGAPYFLLDTCRLRQFGGSTNHWHGLLGQLDDLDFSRREWIEHSGWPIDRAHLQPYYEEARRIFGLGAQPFDVSAWEDPETRPRLPLGSRLRHTVNLLVPPVPFGHAYREELVSSPNVTIYTFANATELVTDKYAREVISVQVASLSGRSFSVRPRCTVLACGGIENARLLLLSDGVVPQGLGNQYDLVGRFFMEHPMLFPAGFFYPAVPNLSFELYAGKLIGDTTVQTGLVPSRKVQEERRLSHVSLLFLPEAPDPDTAHQPHEHLRAASSEGHGIGAGSHVVRAAAEGSTSDGLDRHVLEALDDIRTHAAQPGMMVRRAAPRPRYKQVGIVTRQEQIPNRESRVTLSSERDRLGQRRVRLNWQLTADDRRSSRETVEVLTQELGAEGLGHMKIQVDEDDTSWIPPRDRWPWEKPAVGAYHHMGTTRMADSPRRGVVDASARVHGLKNLYVAGSSIFPTSGHCPPTMTIVALSLRLADHLLERVG